jgi:hypothetical protein
VVGVQDEQQVERLRRDRIEVERLARYLEHHVQEARHVFEVVARIADRPADRIAVRGGSDRRHLRDQADRGEAALLGIVEVERVVVERRHRRDRRAQHCHRMRVVMEAVQKVLERLMHHRVMRDLVLERRKLRLAGQFAVDEQVSDFEEARILGELVDRIAAIEQHALVAVDEGHRAARRRRRHETGIEREVAGVLVELADVERGIAHRACDDGKGGAVGGVGQGDGFVGHGRFLRRLRRASGAGRAESPLDGNRTVAAGRCNQTAIIA